MAKTKSQQISGPDVNPTLLYWCLWKSRNRNKLSTARALPTHGNQKWFNCSELVMTTLVIYSKCQKSHNNKVLAYLYDWLTLIVFFLLSIMYILRNKIEIIQLKIPELEFGRNKIFFNFYFKFHEFSSFHIFVAAF